MRRALLYCAAIAFAIACGDSITEPIPDRTPATTAVSVATPVAFATTTTEDGLSISTDKDDYQPGDTVHFTGSGWQPGDVLDIVLTDDPLTHEPHTWSVSVGGDGMFHDSTYVVDTGDLGVTFTLTATSTLTGRSLTVVFTDNQNNIVFATPGVSQTPFSPNQSTGVKDATTFTLSNPAGTSPNTTLRIRTGTTVIGGTLVRTFTPIDVPGNTSPTFVWDGKNGDTPTPTFVADGIYTARITTGSGGGLTENDATEKKRTIVVDNTNPTVAVNAIPGGTTGSPITITGTASDLPNVAGAGLEKVEVTIRRSSDDAVLASGNATNTGTNFSTWSFSYTPGEASAQKANAKATDNAGNNATSADQAFTTLDPVVATQTTVESSQNPSVSGQSVTFTATVKSGSPLTPIGAHGAVSFRQGSSNCTDGSEVKAPTGLNASGQATYITSFVASGSPYDIRACYGGSTGFDPSNDNVSQVVNKASTSTVVTTSKTPTVFSEPVTFNVTVSADAPGSGTPAGNVTLKDGTCAAGADLGGPTALNGSGQATFNVSSLTAGSHTVTACYLGNDDYSESNGFVTQTVNRAETSTSVSSNANPSVFSQTVTFTVTVTPDAPAVATPVGEVTLRNGDCTNGTAIGGPTSLNTYGKVSFNISTLEVGTHTITACYAGNSNFEPSDGFVSQVVNKAETSTAVSSNANPSVFSQTVTFTVTVTPDAPAVATPQGDVTLKDGTCAAGATIGGPTGLNASGVVSFNVSTLAVGPHTITGCYAGNASFEESDGYVSQQVNQALTSTAITSSPNPSILAQPVDFGVTVSPVSPAVATPEGYVTLKDGTCSTGTTIGGPALLDGTGQVSFNVSTLAVGPHTITACYAGSTNFKESYKSLAQAQQVNYRFDGLFAPVDRPNMMNVSKVGQAVPLKWRLTDYYFAPVINFAPTALGVAVSAMPCDVGAALDQIEEYAGNSGLQNLGNGYYQYNWKTTTSYANTCKQIGLNLGEGSPRGPLANFNFKK